MAELKQEREDFEVEDTRKETSAKRDCRNSIQYKNMGKRKSQIRG